MSYDRGDFVLGHLVRFLYKRRNGQLTPLRRVTVCVYALCFFLLLHLATPFNSAARSATPLMGIGEMLKAETIGLMD